MKVEVHVPVEQYGYASATFDTDDLKSIAWDEQIRNVYDHVKAAFAEKPQNTMPDKEYTNFLAKMLKNEAYHVDEWEAMSDNQRRFCNLLKNAKARK